MIKIILLILLIFLLYKLYNFDNLEHLTVEERRAISEKNKQIKAQKELEKQQALKAQQDKLAYQRSQIVNAQQYKTPEPTPDIPTSQNLTEKLKELNKQEMEKNALINKTAIDKSAAVSQKLATIELAKENLKRLDELDNLIKVELNNIQNNISNPDAVYDSVTRINGWSTIIKPIYDTLIQNKDNPDIGPKLDMINTTLTRVSAAQDTASKKIVESLNTNFNNVLTNLNNIVATLDTQFMNPDKMKEMIPGVNGHISNSVAQLTALKNNPKYVGLIDMDSKINSVAAYTNMVTQKYNASVAAKEERDRKERERLERIRQEEERRRAEENARAEAARRAYDNSPEKAAKEALEKARERAYRAGIDMATFDPNVNYFPEAPAPPSNPGSIWDYTYQQPAFSYTPPTVKTPQELECEKLTRERGNDPTVDVVKVDDSRGCILRVSKYGYAKMEEEKKKMEEEKKIQDMINQQIEKTKQFSLGGIANLTSTNSSSNSSPAYKAPYVPVISDTHNTIKAIASLF